MEKKCTKAPELKNKLLSNVQLEWKAVNRSWIDDVEEYESDVIEVSNWILPSSVTFSLLHVAKYLQQLRAICSIRNFLT